MTGAMQRLNPEARRCEDCREPLPIVAGYATRLCAECADRRKRASQQRHSWHVRSKGRRP